MPEEVTTRPEFLLKLRQTGSLNVIFQLTDRCVLSCRYCYAKGSHQEAVAPFDEQMLDKAIKSAFETRHHEIAFEWTGGEPFLMGTGFYETVHALQKKHATKPYTNTVQTSGYLHDRALISWLASHGFHLSMTIDGPEEIHDFNRPTADARPSLNTILETRRTILEHQGSCGCICTVTQKSLGHEHEILDFYRSLGINSFHSNPYLFFPGNLVGDEPIALDNEGYASYFINQFNAWFDKGRKTPVPGTVEYILKCLLKKASLSKTICTFGGRCLGNFVAITPGGDAWPCPKFVGFDALRLGNIGNSSMEELLSEDSPAMSRLIDERLCAIHACESENCQFRYLCNSGCPYYSFIAGNGKDISEKDLLCEGKKILFQYLESVTSLMDQPDPGMGR